MPVMDGLVEWASIRFADRLERTVGFTVGLPLAGKPVTATFLFQNAFGQSGAAVS
jgi:hypothetical protein